MEKIYYENLLRKNSRGSEESEKMWDQRAVRFYEAQKNDRSTFTQEVVNVLRKRGILEKAEILDIGGGSGRYALPLAKEGRHVVLTDISGNMLKLARENAEQNGVENISFEKLVWETASLSDLKWEKKFDLAFASMCPAIRTPEGLYKMAEASKGYCVINQYIR
ncbi:MAG: class I SAM-dependent methyltransferase, partial [Filifactor alocis]|nr:class I SAM-dependent methyltransferase [Filifactor alocis]